MNASFGYGEDRIRLYLCSRSEQIRGRTVLMLSAAFSSLESSWMRKSLEFYWAEMNLMSTRFTKAGKNTHK
jgi:hypothetical protein